MASHNNTPASVLDAPALEPVYLTEFDGANRKALRAVGHYTGKTRKRAHKAVRFDWKTFLGR